MQYGRAADDIAKFVERFLLRWEHEFLPGALKPGYVLGLRTQLVDMFTPLQGREVGWLRVACAANFSETRIGRLDPNSA